MTSRYDNIQKYLKNIGEYGCFFLSLLSIAEEYTGRKIDLVDAVRWGIDSKAVGNDFTIYDDCKLLSHLTGKRVSKSASQGCGVLSANQFSVEKWYNGRTGYNHFRRRCFDVYNGSVTVREGCLVCYYIYTIGGK